MSEQRRGRIVSGPAPGGDVWVVEITDQHVPYEHGGFGKFWYQSKERALEHARDYIVNSIDQLRDDETDDEDDEWLGSIESLIHDGELDKALEEWQQLARDWDIEERIDVYAVPPGVTG